MQRTFFSPLLSFLSLLAPLASALGAGVLLRHGVELVEDGALFLFWSKIENEFRKEKRKKVSFFLFDGKHTSTSFFFFLQSF